MAKPGDHRKMIYSPAGSSVAEPPAARVVDAASTNRLYADAREFVPRQHYSDALGAPGDFARSLLLDYVRYGTSAASLSWATMKEDGEPDRFHLTVAMLSRRNRDDDDALLDGLRL